MDEDRYDYEKDLEIDPDALDVEWLQHASLFMKYAEAQAAAKKRLDKAHERVKIVRSKLVKRIKEQEGGTQQEIEAKYRMSPRHKKAKEEMIQAEYELNLLNSAVSAFHARRSALENLVRLHGQSYFAGPQEPRDLGQSFREKAEDARDKRVRRRSADKTKKKRRKRSDE